MPKAKRVVEVVKVVDVQAREEVYAALAAGAEKCPVCEAEWGPLVEGARAMHHKVDCPAHTTDKPA